MIPLFAPLKDQIEIDKEEILWELSSSGVLGESIVATTTFFDGQSHHKSPAAFNETKFEDTASVTHYDEDGELQDGADTFFMNSLTYIDERSKRQSWDKSRTVPLWVKHDEPWFWRDDVPYTKSVIKNLPWFEYVTTTRVISLKPNTSGVIHADSGRIMNQKYYADGNASITINILTGGGNLHFIDEFSNTHTIDEDSNTFWHFDDSTPHCVPKVNSHRLQLRIFGRLEKNYQDILDMEKAIW